MFTVEYRRYLHANFTNFVCKSIGLNELGAEKCVISAGDSSQNIFK